MKTIVAHLEHHCVPPVPMCGTRALLQVVGGNSDYALASDAKHPQSIVELENKTNFDPDHIFW